MSASGAVEVFVAGVGGGWAVSVRRPRGGTAEASGGEAGASSYRMELRAILEGLERAPGRADVSVRVQSDAALRACARSMHTWKAKGWRKKGGKVAHADLLRTIESRLRGRPVCWDRADPARDRAVVRRCKELARTAAAANGSGGAGDEQEDAGVQGSGDAGASARGGRDANARPEARGGAAPAARVVAYTDGGCRGNPGVGGWGFLLIDGRSGQALERRGGDARTTNNRMELTAVVEALAAVKGAGQSVEVRSDSRYVVNLASKWVAGWKARGWRLKSGEPVKNRELVERLDALAARHRVQWRWVAGHAGEPGNEHADRLTNEAMDAIERGEDPAAETRYEVSPVDP